MSIEVLNDEIQPWNIKVDSTSRKECFQTLDFCLFPFNFL